MRLAWQAYMLLGAIQFVLFIVWLVFLGYTWASTEDDIHRTQRRNRSSNSDDWEDKDDV